MKFCDANPYIRFAQRFFFKRHKVIFNVFDCRIMYILKGCLDIVIEGQKHCLSDDSLFYCPSGSVYEISSVDGCDICVLNFDFDTQRSSVTSTVSPIELLSADKPVFEKNNIFDDCPSLNSHVAIEKAVFLKQAMADITDEFNEKRIFFREKASAILKELVCEIVRHELNGDEKTTKMLDTIITYIRKNPKGDLSNKKLASVAGYHEYHLNRLFLKYTGVTIHKYIIEARIERAKKLLLASDMTTAMIAEELGFCGSAHFASCFKRLVGCNPSEYKSDMGRKI